jgi:glycosyltransferase involved in cell wall biosynthesis
MTPTISTLITAYNRREYLGQAVESALNQTLPRTEYEVVVTKNFDHELDNDWTSRGVKLIYFDGAGLGKRVADALPYCSGRYIAFLDDDWWAKNRLERVYSKLKENPLAAYYKNGLVLVDYDSLKPFDYDTSRPILNSSSIVIDRSIVESNLDLLTQIGLSVDDFYYFRMLGFWATHDFDKACLTFWQTPRSRDYRNRERRQIYGADRLVIQHLVARCKNRYAARAYRVAMGLSVYWKVVHDIEEGGKGSLMDLWWVTQYCVLSGNILASKRWLSLTG